MAGLRRYWLEAGCNIEAFQREAVSNARQSARLVVGEKRKREIQKMSPQERMKLEDRYIGKVPFTEEMLQADREKNFSDPSATIMDKMAYVATALALHIGNRPGEFSSNGPLTVDEENEVKDRDHRFTTKDILFQKEITGEWNKAMDITEENKNEFDYISVMVETHKGERVGKQAKTKREANAVRRNGGGLESELFNDMMEWTIAAKLKEGDFFFSRNVYNVKGVCSNLKLPTGEVVKRMKSAAISQGIDPKHISAKSLRKGCASALSKSGISDETINMVGRWAPGSSASRVYVHSTGITGALSDGIERIVNKDVNRMNISKKG